MTTREAVDHNPELSHWNKTTILTFIGRLHGRGFIRIEKMSDTGRTNVYTPLVTQREYKGSAYQDFVKSVMGGNRVELASLLIGGMSPGELKSAHSNIPGIFPES